jgi:hypothetical protein
MSWKGGSEVGIGIKLSMKIRIICFNDWLNPLLMKTVSKTGVN